MPSFSWVFHAPSGVYKSHAMSRRLFEAAVENSLFVDHTMPADGYGRKMGESVTLTRVRNVTEPVSAVLDENSRIPEDEFQLSVRSITVSELGRAIPFTSLSQDLSEYDLGNPIQRKLRNQMRLVLDTLAAAAFKRTQIKYVPTGTSGTPTNNITTNGTPGAQASRNVQMFDVEQIRDYLFDTLNAEPGDNDDYVGIFRTLGLRGIKNDATWQDWHRYTDPQVKFNGEVGRIEGVRFVESNHARALGKIGASSALGEGVIFGADAVVIAEALAPELRAAIPSDFGRAKAVAWYGILAFEPVWDTGNQGEANIVHVSST
jgi:N4-gp56 family major capsid protein